MEVFHQDGRRDDGGGAFAAARAFGRPHRQDIVQYGGRAFVEPEVVDRLRDPAVFDEEVAVACETGQQDGERIDHAYVPEARHEDAPFYLRDHLVEGGGAAAQDEVPGRGDRPGVLLARPVAGIEKAFYNAALDPGLLREREALA